MTRRPLLVDVDTGVDDAIALAYLVAAGADLRAVTTVAGNVPVNVATANTLRVLHHMGATGIPVHRGASRPLAAPLHFATHIHGENGLGGGAFVDSPEREHGLAGPAAIVAAGREHAGALEIITLGPLTNLAIALNVRPQLVDQVRRLTIMGGAYHVAGNVTPRAEFNVFADPDAAGQVLNAGFRDMTLIGLDVTHQTLISRELWSRIPAEAGPGAQLVRRVLGRTFVERDRTGHFMHDPLAAAVALDPSLVGGERCSVTVTREGDLRGQTAVAQSDEGGLVARTVDAARFQGLLAQALKLPEVASTVGFERAE